MDEETDSDDISDTPILTEEAEKDESLYLVAKNTVLIREDLDSAPTEYRLPKESILPPWDKKSPEEQKWKRLLVGFDTEYQSFKELFTSDDVKKKQAKYEVLSYQFYADNTSLITTGIVIPDAHKRISFTEFIVYIAAKIAAKGEMVPRSIILVGHYNKADFPAFDDRDQVFKKLSNIRNSLVSRSYPVSVRVFFSDQKDDFIELKVYVRDSILLAPAGQKSLAAVGSLLKIEKKKLDEDPQVELDLKRNMKVVRDNKWPLFKEYAIVDAEISAKYFDAMMALYRETTGIIGGIPSALSNIGVTLLRKEWGDRRPPLDRLEAIGKELFKEQVWNDETNNFFTLRDELFVEELSWYIDFGTECYHGGRSEQLWFGPSFEDDWSDYDLASAYPTAMATIGKADWHAIYPTTELSKLRLGSFAFACVDFKFLQNVRYPTLPVRTGNGIIFPLEGRSYCSAPEIELALNLGCELKVKHGVVIPHDESQKIFEPFIAKTINLRNTAPTDIEKAFWKEITNSCYGKTAQGLRAKRVFNLKKMRTVQIPHSQITNPFFAAYITSMVRAVVGEIINAVPEDKMVFSVTTDGFLTNATDEQMDTATKGPICRVFSEARRAISGSPIVHTKKHGVRQLLGWRTRGQATIKPGPKSEKPSDPKPYVLAKASIRTPIATTNISEQNEYILTMFFERVAGRKFDAEIPTSMKDIMLLNTDYVMKQRQKTVSMEYDFKRRPRAATMMKAGKWWHLAFSTKPWRTVEDFKNVRAVWDDLYKNLDALLKTTDDYRAFAEFYDAKKALEGEKGRYFKTDVNRLKRDLCAAFGNGEAGLDDLKMTAREFAELLNECGFRGTKDEVARGHVEYGRKAKFIPNATPTTAAVMAISDRLKALVPTFRPEDLLVAADPQKALLSALSAERLIAAQSGKGQ